MALEIKDKEKLKRLVHASATIEEGITSFGPLAKIFGCGGIGKVLLGSGIVFHDGDGYICFKNHIHIDQKSASMIHELVKDYHRAQRQAHKEKLENKPQTKSNEPKRTYTKRTPPAEPSVESSSSEEIAELKVMIQGLVAEVKHTRAAVIGLQHDILTNLN